MNPAAQILWFFGSPEAVSHIGQGETVQWQWWDNLAHSVEGVGAAEGMFTGIGGGNVTVAGKGFLYNYTFNVPGTFKYRCANHTTAMIGTVMVKPKFNFGGVLLPWYDGVSIGGASAIVRQGDTVQWQWLDFLGHSLLTSGGAPEEFTGPGANGSIITQYGFVYNRTFTKTGSYPYVCSVHGASMKGIIRVLPSTATVPPSPPLPGPPGPDPSEWLAAQQKRKAPEPRPYLLNKQTSLSGPQISVMVLPISLRLGATQGATQGAPSSASLTHPETYVLNPEP